MTQEKTADPRAGGFEPTYFARLAALEEGSFWFRSRNELIVWAIRKYARSVSDILEVGCGTGYVLERIHRAFRDASLTGTELLSEGLTFAAERVPSATLTTMGATASPFVEAFDVAGAFDVLEHIEDDRAALAGLHRALRPGGLLVVTVPQHPSLWSAEDDQAHHVRRYTGRELWAKVEAAGFRIERMTSFVTLLLPAMVVSRRRTRGGLADLRQPVLIDRALSAVMAVERGMIRLGVWLPVGGSLLVLARKPSS